MVPFGCEQVLRGGTEGWRQLREGGLQGIADAGTRRDPAYEDLWSRFSA